MRIESLGGLRARITGGDDREGGGRGPVVVLLHGFGAPGDDLVSLARVIDAPRGTRFVFPEAPLTIPGYGDGRAWWLLDTERLTRMAQGQAADFVKEVPAGLEEARTAATAMLVALERLLAPSKVVLGGFSQGAMLACDVVLRTDRPFAGLAMLSGTFLCSDEWIPRMASRHGLPVFLSHGAADALLPFATSDRLRDAFSAAGMRVTWLPFRGGHEIPPSVIDGLGKFLRALSD